MLLIYPKFTYLPQRAFLSLVPHMTPYIIRSSSQIREKKRNPPKTSRRPTEKGFLFKNEQTFNIFYIGNFTKQHLHHHFKQQCSAFLACGFFPVCLSHVSQIATRPNTGQDNTNVSATIEMSMITGQIKNEVMLTTGVPIYKPYTH